MNQMVLVFQCVLRCSSILPLLATLNFVTLHGKMTKIFKRRIRYWYRRSLTFTTGTDSAKLFRLKMSVAELETKMLVLRCRVGICKGLSSTTLQWSVGAPYTSLPCQQLTPFSGDRLLF